MQITVLGAGMVGSAIARKLAQTPGFSVTAADRSAQTLAELEQRAPVRTVCVDLSAGESIRHLAAQSDLVISAVPGFMGFATLKTLIEAGKNVVDISFFEQDAFDLDALARLKGVTAVVDCGVAPGLSNIIAGYARNKLDELDRIDIAVGGLPQARHWPFEYKAVFSPVDVIEIYTRSAWLVENGREVARPALSGLELIDFPGVGTLEAFNTDGLRTLRRTLRAPNMRERTLRYPGHANLMRVFRESGFFGDEAIDIQGQHVRPIDLTSRLLFEQWRLGKGDADLTVFQTVVEGRKGGQRLRLSYDMVDHYDEATGTTSMARTTGYTCAAVARQVLDGRFAAKGICAPEDVGRTPGCYEALLADLAHSNLHLTETITAIP
jgi:saccharopine dehydrogenase-like NADP-dependent oxidoreductase